MFFKKKPKETDDQKYKRGYDQCELALLGRDRGYVAILREEFEECRSPAGEDPYDDGYEAALVKHEVIRQNHEALRRPTAKPVIGPRTTIGAVTGRYVAQPKEKMLAEAYGKGKPLSFQGEQHGTYASKHVMPSDNIPRASVDPKDVTRLPMPEARDVRFAGGTVSLHIKQVPDASPNADGEWVKRETGRLDFFATDMRHGHTLWERLTKLCDPGHHAVSYQVDKVEEA